MNITTAGEGDDLVVLHGWALHSGVFDGIADALRERFRVHFVDLPGHGHNAHVPLADDIDAVADAVLDAVPGSAHWLGWSLGGTVSLAAALKAPERVRKLVMVASTPRFVTDSGWPHAIAEEMVVKMAADLEADFHRTVQNFLALQVLGDANAQGLLRELREKLFAHGEPARASLANGLRILRNTDLLPRLGELESPLLAIMGSRDRLAPPAAGEALAERVPDGKAVTIPRCAHAPFISHREVFLSLVSDFLG